MKIRTNKISYTLNVERILASYDVFFIIYKGERFDVNILDASIDGDCKARSVVYIRGKKAFMLFDKNTITADDLCDILNKRYSKPLVDVKPLVIFNEDYQRRTLFRLLMNGIHNCFSEGNMYNNLTGRLYYFCKRWRYHKEELDRIWCLKLTLTDDDVITAMVETFLSKDAKTVTDEIKLVFDKKTSVLRKVSKSDKVKQLFVKESRGWNSSVTALNFDNKERFKNSKYGVLHQFRKDMLESYPDMVDFDWVDYEAEDMTISERELKNIENRNYSERFNSRGLTLVNLAGDDGCQCFNELKRILTEKEIHFVEASQVDKNTLNLAIIKSKDEYSSSEEDPYKKTKHFNVQHVINRELGKEAIQVILNELIIKDDLYNGRIGTVNWSSYKFANNISFATIKRERGKADVYFVIHIMPSGQFEKRKFCVPEIYEDISIRNAFLKDPDNYPDWVDSNIEFVMWEDIDDIYAFKKSEEILLPEMDKLGNTVLQINPKKKVSSTELLSYIDTFECSEDDKRSLVEIAQRKDCFSLRDLRENIEGKSPLGKSFRKHLKDNGIFLRVSKSKDSDNGLANYTGVKYFIDPDRDSICHFYVGMKNGISKYSFEKSVLVRSIQRNNGSPISIEYVQKLLRLPQVTFVKSGQYSVHPFIYKYLTEYMEVES